LVSDIPAGDGKIDILFCTVYRLFFTLKDYYDNIVRVISSKYSVDENKENKDKPHIYSPSKGERTYYCYLIVMLFLEFVEFFCRLIHFMQLTS
jgi:hypothetical protein